MGWYPCCCLKDCGDCSTCVNGTIEITDMGGGACETIYPSTPETTLTKGSGLCYFSGGWVPGGDILAVNIRCVGNTWRIYVFSSGLGSGCDADSWETYVKNTDGCPPRGTFVLPKIEHVDGDGGWNGDGLSITIRINW